jgi:hypothetical protein
MEKGPFCSQIWVRVVGLLGALGLYVALNLTRPFVSFRGGSVPVGWTWDLMRLGLRLMENCKFGANDQKH